MSKKVRGSEIGGMTESGGGDTSHCSMIFTWKGTAIEGCNVVRDQTETAIHTSLSW